MNHSPALAASSPHPSELSVARARRLVVFAFHLGDLVALDRFAFGIDVNSVQTRGVQPEDLRFDFRREFLIAELLRDLIADLEAAQALDL